MSIFSKANGVAVVTPSNVNILMLSGQAASRKALAAKAGFIKLHPIPPKFALLILWQQLSQYMPPRGGINR